MHLYLNQQYENHMIISSLGMKVKNELDLQIDLVLSSITNILARILMQETKASADNKIEEIEKNN